MNNSLTNMTAEEIDGLSPLEESRLTDAELEHIVEAAGSTYAAHLGMRAIEELRDRRRAMLMCAAAEADIDELREQNAALKAEWNEENDRLRERIRILEGQNAKLMAALASVKGEQG